MSETTVLDLEQMMEESLDAIPDAPDFCIPPAGEYILQVKEPSLNFHIKMLKKL